MSKHDGGHAFPQQYDDQDGMTLRDYFAAKAMQGMLSGGKSMPQTCVSLAYELADAMLKEREITR